MLEYFLIGLLLGTLGMSHVFPEGKTFYQWIYSLIKREKK